MLTEKSIAKHLEPHFSTALADQNSTGMGGKDKYRVFQSTAVDMCCNLFQSSDFDLTKPA